MQRSVKKPDSIVYYAGLDALVLEVSIPYGKGTTSVRTYLQPGQIVDIARYLAPVLGGEAEDRSHAMWHWMHQSREYPCSQCGIKRRNDNGQSQV